MFRQNMYLLLTAGEGGFGPVYRGVLHGQAVAIKTLAQDSHQGHLEFARELDVLSKVNS